MKRQDLEIERVTVNSVRYRKEDSGWCILALAGGKVAKGVVPFEVGPDVKLCLHGYWQVSKFNGDKEFCFAHAQIDLPENSIDLLHYACTQTTGLGPAKERRIWAAFGEDWPQHPDLEGIEGVNEKVRDAWQQTLREMQLHKDRTDAIAFLLAHECTINMAEACWKEHGAASIAKVSADPYTLSYLPRYGFAQVDGEIRRSFNIADDDPRRIDAAVWYCMVTRCIADGSTVAELSHLQAESEALVPPSDPTRPIFSESVHRLLEAERLIRISDSLVAVRRDAKAEREIFTFAGVA